MSANGTVWGRVRSRLRAFPECFAACGPEAAAYGRCVQASTAPGGRLSKDLCAREFEALRSCFAAAPQRFLVLVNESLGKMVIYHRGDQPVVVKTTLKGSP